MPVVYLEELIKLDSPQKTPITKILLKNRTKKVGKTDEQESMRSTLYSQFDKREKVLSPKHSS